MKFQVTDRCVGCGSCIGNCHGHCMSMVDGRAWIDQSRCLACGSCMTACKMEAILEDGDTYKHPAHEPITLDCDIAVLGSGGAGLVAAARAAAISDKKVIVLEKMPFVGGGMNFAADWRIYGSQWQEKRGLPNLMSEKMRDAMDATNWQLDHELVYQAYQNTGKFFDWFETMVPGYEFDECLYVFDRPHGGQINPFPRDDTGRNSCGLFTSRVLQKYCREHGVEILTRHRAVDVEMENGRISAVIAEDPGGKTIVRCKSVIMSTGSWISNRALLEKLEPDYAKIPMPLEAHTSVAYTGDGIPLAEKLGAYIDYDSMCLRLMGPMGMAPGRALSAISRSPACLFVNLDGKRWVNENTTIRTDNAFGIAQVLVKQPKGVSFTLFERNMVQEVYRRLDGAPLPGNADNPDGPIPIPEDYLEQLDLLCQPDGMQKLMARMGGGPGGGGAPGGGGQSFFYGNTLEELAEKAGISPEGLKETVCAYNEMCRDGMDRAFFKDKEQMVPFGDGPFYAIRGQLSTDGAFGGIQVDKDTRAYGDPVKKTVIPGLYVPGDFAASRFLNYNGVKVQVINDLAWAISSGFSAGNAAVADLNEVK